MQIAWYTALTSTFRAPVRVLMKPLSSPLLQNLSTSAPSFLKGNSHAIACIVDVTVPWWIISWQRLKSNFPALKHLKYKVNYQQRMILVSSLYNWGTSRLEAVWVYPWTVYLWHWNTRNSFCKKSSNWVAAYPRQRGGITQNPPARAILTRLIDGGECQGQSFDTLAKEGWVNL